MQYPSPETLRLKGIIAEQSASLKHISARLSAHDNTLSDLGGILGNESMTSAEIVGRVRELAAGTAESGRLRDGMETIEMIVSAIMPNSGCEKNTVELVQDMADLIQKLRGDVVG